jgi:hypothetical protein
VIPLAKRFAENLAQAWVHLLTATDVDTQEDCLPMLQTALTPTEAFAKATPPCRPAIVIKDLRWGVEVFPIDPKQLLAPLNLPAKEYVAWFTRTRELANLASNIEFPLSMLEALTQEETHPMAPAREEGPWTGLLYPYVQAAKEGLEAMQKVAAEALVQATVFGRDALLTSVKVGLVRGQIFSGLGRYMRAYFHGSVLVLAGIRLPGGFCASGTTGRPIVERSRPQRATASPDGFQ